MSKQVILNLPVKDSEKSKEFFLKMGLSIDAALTDANATCFVVIENVIVALLPESHFKEASMGEVADAAKVSEMLISVGTDSREEVDSLVDNAIKAGALEIHEPVDMDTIYGRSFADLDHHKWNIFYMHGNKTEN